MIIDYMNNIGVGAIAISSVLNHLNKLSLAKVLLIIPFISHDPLLRYLSRSNREVKSIDSIFVDKLEYFSTFNKRYYDSVCLTINTLQYLHETYYLKLQNDHIQLLKRLEYNKAMGKRAEKIFLASRNISNILSDDEIKLYLNLRIEL